MRPWIGWLFLLSALLAPLVGVDIAGWGEPITANDLVRALIALWGVIIIEARTAANYVAKKISDG